MRLSFIHITMSYPVSGERKRVHAHLLSHLLSTCSRLRIVNTKYDFKLPCNIRVIDMQNKLNLLFPKVSNCLQLGTNNSGTTQRV